MAAPSLATVLTTLFVVLGCGISATVIYTIATDGLPFREQLLTPWMAATLVDFYINILVIGAWIIYKESNWIRAIIWIVLLVCLGSITTCGYIVLQFFKLTPQESLQDPIYFVLLRTRKMDETESKGKLSVVGARVLFSVLGCLMLGTLIYTIAINGSPFRQELFTPWFSATLVDFSVNVFALLVWVAYKESNWRSAAIWIILFICLGSVTTCSYIVLQLFHLSPQDPVFLIVFSSSNRAENGYEGSLQAQ